MPSARKQIANVRVETKGRCGVWRRQERKGSRTLRRPLLSKAAHLFELHGNRGEAEGFATPGPRLSPSMIGGPWPVGQRSGCWRRGGEGGIRTARAAGRAQIRQEPEPSGARSAGRRRAPRGSCQGEKSSLPLHDNRNAGIWPHLRFVPHPRWAWGSLSVHTDRGISC
jgi:hypothetical protein